MFHFFFQNSVQDQQLFQISPEHWPGAVSYMLQFMYLDGWRLAIHTPTYMFYTTIAMQQGLPWPMNGNQL